MAGWNGIYFNGVWSCGYDFLPDGTLAAGGVFDIINSTPTVGSASARFTGKGCLYTDGKWATRTYNVNLASSIGGCGFATTGLPIGGNKVIVASFVDTTAPGVNSGQQACLAYDTTGSLRFYQAGGFAGGTAGSPVGTASPAGTIVPNAYNMLEWTVTINGTTGVLECRINQNVVCSFTGNTNVTGNLWTNRIIIGCTNSGGLSSHKFDDHYLLDTTGSAPYNAYLGNGRIQTDGPNADSATGGLNAWAFTTPAGTDFANAANIPANPAQFNSDAVVGDRMSFRFPALSTTKVTFLNTWYSAEQDDAGVRTLVPIYRSNSVDQVGPLATTLTAAYVYYNQPSTIDPNTSASWAVGTVAAAGSAEIGLKVNS